MPPHIAGTPAARIHQGNDLWHHQGKALSPLADGDNAVVSTATASGKTPVFHLRSLHLLADEPEATVLVFHPAKALANGQLLRWRRFLQQAGHDPSKVQQITGDSPMRSREPALSRASVLLMTPDMAHAWLLRNTHRPANRNFLSHLRLVITGEAHVYEDVLGWLRWREFSNKLPRGHKTLDAVSGRPLLLAVIVDHFSKAGRPGEERVVTNARLLTE